MYMRELRKMLWNFLSGIDLRIESKGGERFEEIKCYRFGGFWGYC